MKSFKKILFLAIPALIAYLVLAQSSESTINTSVQKASLEVAKTNQTIDEAAKQLTYPTLHKTIKVNGLDIFLPRSRSKRRTNHFVIARLSNFFSHVPKSDNRFI